nr:TetR/AcrR family transcriptional regulator [Microbulbifer sp. CAU 1566]
MEADKKYKVGKIREQNYKDILEAAKIIFAQYGYKGASMMSIANQAGLPKANIHYYFKSKSLLYAAVLEEIISEWNRSFEVTEDDDPRDALESYILNKVRQSCENPLPSKLFATEIIAGAPYLDEYIRGNMRKWFRHKVEVINSWIAQGKIQPVDPEYLLFMIWSSSQHYGDFESQILKLLNKGEYDDTDIERIGRFVAEMILARCGLTPSWKG